MKKEVLLLSEYERKEILRNRTYKILPAIPILPLVGLRVLASSNPASKFPSLAEARERYIKLLNKPIKGFGFMGHIWASPQCVFIVLGLSWVLGISFGTLIGWNKKANAILGPTFTVLRAVSPLAWVPPVIMWLETGEFPRILTVFIGTLMPVVVNIHAGISNVEKKYLDIGTVFNVDNRQMLSEIAAPSALDVIFAGIRNSTSVGWMVVLAVEMLGGRPGVGSLIVYGMGSGGYLSCLPVMICIGIMGYILAILIQLLGRIVCPWTVRKSV